MCHVLEELALVLALELVDLVLHTQHASCKERQAWSCRDDENDADEEGHERNGND